MLSSCAEEVNADGRSHSDPSHPLNLRLAAVRSMANGTNDSGRITCSASSWEATWVAEQNGHRVTSISGSMSCTAPHAEHFRVRVSTA